MPPTRILTLREERRVAANRGREVLDRAEGEGRDLTAEEREQYDRAHTDSESLRGRIEREERQATLDAELGESRGRTADPPEDRSDPNVTADAAVAEAERIVRERAQLVEVRNFVLTGQRGPELRSRTVDQILSPEMRALQADIDTAGGYTVLPEVFVRELIQAIDDEVFVRKIATVRSVTQAASLGAPVLETDPEDATWTSEIAPADRDTQMDFARRSLEPHALAKEMLVSNKLIRSSVFGVEDLVRDRLAYKFGVTEENAFLTGDGAQKPMGVFTAAATKMFGITTGRDVSTGNADTYPTFDGLKAAKWFLKQGYRRRAQWILHRDVMSVIDRLKDGEGRYIYRESVEAGEPDKLLNMPANISEFAPNTLTAEMYIAILGDFKYYWIADALNMTLQRLVELYARTDQTSFIGRAEVDGMPVMEEAFVRVQLAA